MLGKRYSGAITTTYCSDSEAQDRGPSAGHVVIAWGLPDQPGPAYALTTGHRRLDVVGYDRHINDYYQQDTAEHIQTNHLYASRDKTTSLLIRPTH